MCIEKEYNWKGSGIEEPRQRSKGGMFNCFPSSHLRKPASSPGMKETDSGINNNNLCNSVHHRHSYHPVAMPTALKSSLSWHSAWHVSPSPPPPPPQVIIAGVTVSAPSPSLCPPSLSLASRVLLLLLDLCLTSSELCGRTSLRSH